MNLTLETVDEEFLRQYDYGIKFGDFDANPPTTPLFIFIKANQRELCRRLKEMEAREKREAANRRQDLTPINEFRTQLWEPCERCGREPSYITMRGHLCPNCIGK